MSFKHIKNIPNNVVVRNGYSGFGFPLKLGSLLPGIVAQPIPFNRALNPGLSTILTVEAQGISPLTYKWYKNDVFITGATTNTLTLSGVSLSSAGSYYVTVTNPFGTITSTPVTISINDAAGFITPPQNKTVYYLNDEANDIVSFSATVSGTRPISYSWYRDNSLISGALSSVYSTSYKLSDSGSEYTLSIRNFSSPVSAKATLTVIDTPLGFVSQPISQTINPNFSAITFTIQASGRLPISYQWRKNGTEIIGLTTNSITLTSIQESDEASYDIIISNLSGISNTPVSLTSVAAYLSVNDPIGIVNQPIPEMYMGIGETITLSAEVSGTQPYSFNWYEDGVQISGATLSSYSLTATSEEALGVFFYTASNIVNTVTSNTINLLPAFPPGILHPTVTEELTANPGSSYGMIVAASGSFLQYQWKKDSTEIPLATSNSYFLANIQESDQASYIAVVYNNWGMVSSAPYLISVNDPLSFSAPITGNEFLFPGTEVVLYALISGTPPISYQWYRNDALLIGATLSSYTIPSITQEENGDKYQLVATNIVNTISSEIVTLSVYQPVNITQQPVSMISAFNATNDEATFTVTVTGSTPYVYNWYKDGLSVYTGGSSYTVDNGRALSTTDFGTYFVTVSNIVQRVTSDNVTLGGSFPFIVLESPVSLTTYDGTSAEFRARAVGGDGTILYQWYRNDGLLLGATLSSYVIDPVIAGVNDGTYKVNISSVRGEANPIATLSSYPLYGVWDFIHPGPTTTLNGFTVQLTSDGLQFIVWGDGTYNTNVDSGSSTSHTYASALSVGFVQNLSPLNAYFETAALSTFSVVASGTDVRYEWYLKDGIAPTTLISGATSSSYTFDSRFYSINSLLLYSRIYNSINSITSLTANIDVNSP